MTPSNRELRIFSGLLAVFCSGIAALLVRRGLLAAEAGWGLALGGVGLAVIGLCRPALVRPVHRAWHAVTAPIGRTVSGVVLAAVFVLVVTPIGLLLRCLRHDPLDRSRDAAAPTYWTKRRQPARDDEYFRQF